jgi:hypothetical protein
MGIRPSRLAHLPAFVRVFKYPAHSAGQLYLPEPNRPKATRCTRDLPVQKWQSFGRTRIVVCSGSEINADVLFEPVLVDLC